MNENLPAPEATVKKNLMVRHENQRMKRNRRSVRLKGYDYSQAGAYFVTVCVRNRECLFGDIMNGEMILNDTGRTVSEEWRNTPEIRPNIELDEFVVMPNHFHAVVVVTERRGVLQYAPTNARPSRSAGAGLRSPSQTVGAIIRGFKSAVTKRINEMRRTPGAKLWQRSYYEHIIRNEKELNAIREYIINNPLKWEVDRENPTATDANHGTGTAHTSCGNTVRRTGTACRARTEMAEPWEAGK